MSAISVSSVNAYTAHHEWASRPEDERFSSVAALVAAARARRARTVDYTTDSRDIRVEATGTDSLQLLDAGREPIALTHWSFGQLAAVGGAPAQYLRTLPAPIAADALNHGLARQRRGSHQLYIDRVASAPPKALALTSPKYARVHHDHLAGRVLDLMAEHPEWHLPLGYKNGQWGAERVPSGAYLGDRDMFLFLVDGNRDLDDPTDQGGRLFRGFILRNSDVGAAALTLDLFLFRLVCGNHLIWGFQRLASFRRRHIGTSIDTEWDISLDAITAALNADTTVDRTILHRAAQRELGSTREAVIDAVVSRAELSQKQAGEAYAIAEANESNPRSVWGFVQGLTRLSQRSPWQDQRFAADRAASRLLAAVA